MCSMWAVLLVHWACLVNPGHQGAAWKGLPCSPCVSRCRAWASPHYHRISAAHFVILTLHILSFVILVQTFCEGESGARGDRCMLTLCVLHNITRKDIPFRSWSGHLPDLLWKSKIALHTLTPLVTLIE